MPSIDAHFWPTSPRPPPRGGIGDAWHRWHRIAAAIVAHISNADGHHAALIEPGGGDPLRAGARLGASMDLSRRSPASWRVIGSAIHSPRGHGDQRWKEARSSLLHQNDPVTRSAHHHLLTTIRANTARYLITLITRLFMVKTKFTQSLRGKKEV